MKKGQRFQLSPVYLAVATGDAAGEKQKIIEAISATGGCVTEALKRLPGYSLRSLRRGIVTLSLQKDIEVIRANARRNAGIQRSNANASART